MNTYYIQLPAKTQNKIDKQRKDSHMIIANMTLCIYYNKTISSMNLFNDKSNFYNNIQREHLFNAIFTYVCTRIYNPPKLSNKQI